MAELAEGARLLSEYGGKLPSRVRIPLSPPQAIIPEINYISGFLLLEYGSLRLVQNSGVMRL